MIIDKCKRQGCKDQNIQVTLTNHTQTLQQGHTMNKIINDLEEKRIIQQFS